MNPRATKRTWQRLGVLAFGAACWLSLGGCPVDTDDVLTATVQAALEAAVQSLVQTLGTYLAGN